MPCRSDHMNPTPKEVQLSQLLGFLEEVQGAPFNPSAHKGYHPDSYMQHPTQEKINKCTSKLCFLLGTDQATKYSPALQEWWKEHQEWDKKDGR